MPQPAPASSSPSQANDLRNARSAYLRAAAHQPVRWMEWGPEPFRRAQAEEKPILLDIGAVWCHWCHVMDHESYEDAAIAGVINRHYVAVKVDRDERPDVDARYQAAVGAMAGQGGWPLTAILTGDGRPFFGGTYFPPDDRAGRPGLKRVLETMAGVWRERRKEIVETAGSVMAAIEEGETFASEGELGPELIDGILNAAMGSYDARHGGFGTQPKFPNPAAMDLLIDVASRTGNKQLREAANTTLLAMSSGGMYDQLASGFHRYSTDERWAVPHFEKLLYDNAGLLGNYAHAYACSGGDERFAEVARALLGWLIGTMADREQGGFYASQAADARPGDDGDHWTWTRAEVQAALGEGPEAALACALWHVEGLGDMQHNPQRHVLRQERPLAEVAKQLAIAPEHAEAVLARARAGLLRARAERPQPFRDRTVYTGWNALAVSACLAAWSALGLEEARRFALLTLDRVLRTAWDGRELGRVVAYADGERGAAPGVLEDYCYLLHACLDAWEATGALRFYAVAVELGDAVVERFADAKDDGFFDTEQSGEVLGALGVVRKPIQDAPTPAGNGSAAAGLLRLAALSGREEWRELAADTLRHFAGVAPHLGLYAGAYGMAVEQLLLPPLQVVVVGAPEEEQTRALAAAARRPWQVGKFVLCLRREQVAAEALPPVLAETLPRLPALGGERSFAVVCRGAVCLPPVFEVEALLDSLSKTSAG